LFAPSLQPAPALPSGCWPLIKSKVQGPKMPLGLWTLDFGLWTYVGLVTKMLAAISGPITWVSAMGVLLPGGVTSTRMGPLKGLRLVTLTVASGTMPSEAA